MSNTPVEIRWIEEEVPENNKPPPVNWDSTKERTLTSTLLKKCGDNILVPLGLVATTACLTLGLISLQRGDSKKQQVFMRGRIIAQTFTLGAMVFGMYFTQKKTDGTSKTRSPSK